MASTQPFALYNPALLPPEALLAEFIARQPLLETLLTTIRQNAVGQSPQHVLLVGSRGMGKTTTLWAIAHRVDQDLKLKVEWQPVVFDEESRRVGDLADFWLEAIRQWEHAVKDPGDRTKALLDHAGDDIEDQARETFLQMVEQSGRRALLLVDNLNDLLSSIRDPAPLHRLRAQLMEDSSVMLVGGATRYFAHITDVDQPFYDFFRVFELAPLTLAEMKQCLTSLAKSRGDTAVQKSIAEREGTMRSLHLLTGGNPRLIKTFYRLLAEGLQGDIRTDLEHLLDEFTPYFKAIVDALPVQQQRIFDAVALHWDPVDVATVSKAIRVPSNQVSAQLRQLVKTGHIAEASGNPKRKRYLLADRFSNIHYLVRHGRAARNRFDWFIAILQLIFPDTNQADTLAKLALRTAEAGPDGMRDAHDLLHSALVRSASDLDRKRLLETTLRESWNSDAYDKLSSWFDVTAAKTHLPDSDLYAFCQQMPAALRKEIEFKPEATMWWCKLAGFFEEKSAWRLAETAYRKAIELDPNSTFPWMKLAFLYNWHLNLSKEAEATYQKMIVMAPDKSYPWIGLGNLFSKIPDRYDEAETAYRRAIEIDPNDSDPWFGLASHLNHRLNRFEEAEAAYRKSIEIAPNHSDQWAGLAHLLDMHFNRFDEAEAAFREAIKIDPKNDYAMAGLAFTLSRNVGKEEMARVEAMRALKFDPTYTFARTVFTQICSNYAEDWHAVLESLVKKCAITQADTDLFEFTVDGFVSLARLTSSSEALKLLESIPEAKAPFETLHDALTANNNQSHLDRMAPERRVVAIELMNQISIKS